MSLKDLRFSVIDVPFIQPQSWESLFQHEPPYKGDVLLEIFGEYAFRTTEMSIFQTDKAIEPKLRHPLMKSVLRDIFMKYAILNEPEKTEKTKNVSRLLGFERTLCDDIEVLLKEKFDPDWKTCQSVHLSEYKANAEGIAYLSLEDGFFPELLTRNYELSLLRYRLVQQLNTKYQERNQFSVAKVLPQQESLSASEPLIPQLGIPKEKKEASDGHSTPLPKRRRSFSTVVISPILTIRGRLRKESSQNLEHDPAKEDTPIHLIEPLMEVLNHLEKGIKLSPENLKSLFFYLLNYHLKKIGRGNGEILDFLSSLSQMVFKMSSTTESFEELRKELDQCASEVVRKQKKERYRAEIKNLWAKCCSGELKKEEEFSTLMGDLNKACISIYCQVIPEEINERIPNYLSHPDVAEKGPPSENGSGKPLVDLFNQLSWCVAHSILIAKKSTAVTKVMHQWIKLAMEAFKSPILNLHVAFAILAGLNILAVERLKTPHDKLDEESKKSLEKLNLLFNPEKNFKNYRTYLETSIYPVIPYFGITTRDFSLATESDPSVKQSEVVRIIVAGVKKSIRLLQSTTVARKEKPERVSALLAIVGEPLTIEQPPKYHDVVGARDWAEGEWETLEVEEKLWQLSKHLHP